MAEGQGESDFGSPEGQRPGGAAPPPSDLPVRHNCDHYADHRHGDLDHRRYGDEGVDICIVGAGAAGSVLAHRLARAGLSVVVVEAGPSGIPPATSPATSWRCRSWAGRTPGWWRGATRWSWATTTPAAAVGGGTTHFTGVFLRFHESDFRTRSADGVGADWLLTYADLAPYHSAIERETAVSGPRHFPWGSFRGPYPYPERAPLSPNAEVFRRGCARLGVRSAATPLAILAAPFEGRPPCINRGFCNQGCKPNSK